MADQWDDLLDDLSPAPSERGVEDRWVTVAEAARLAGVSRSALRQWYRTDQVSSRVVPGPHGPQRVLSLLDVRARAQRTGRSGTAAAKQAADTPAGREPDGALVALVQALVAQADARAAEAEARERRAEARAERAEARAERAEARLAEAQARLAAAEARAAASTPS